MGKIPALPFQEMLEYSTGDNPNAIITVGTIKNGKASYTIYGENGKELPAELHTSGYQGFYFADCHNSLKEINASTEQYKMMGINMDEIGMAWLIDKENNIIWHNRGTGNYNCYLGFHPETETAVVVLSNLSPNTKIPATVLGIKLLTEL